MNAKIFAIVIFCLVTLSNCRPQNDKIDIPDTSSEFVIKKPETTDIKYTDFLDELYKKDQAKQPIKTKRDTQNQDEKILFDALNLYDDTPVVEEIASIRL